MKFSKAEQKIIKVIVECENQCENLAAALNYSRLLEERGIGIVGVTATSVICVDQFSVLVISPDNAAAAAVGTGTVGDGMCNISLGTA